VKIANLSFGSTAAIVTSMALILGLDAATATKSTIVSGLLIVALADNLTDALSMHVYEESHRRLAPREAFLATASNFVARLAVSLAFVLLVIVLPVGSAIVTSLALGLGLLVILTWALARERKGSLVAELFKHIAGALVVLLLARGVGTLIASQFPPGGRLPGP
jgi:VIT1/CCC1 family predicted Fe2+/Mn2+ transporter